MAQWWEHSPVTNLSQGFKSRRRTPYVGWVCWWFSPLLRDVFLRLLWFSLFLKNPAFSNCNFTRNKIDEEPLRGSATSKMVVKSLLVEPELSILSYFYFRLHDEIHFSHRPKRIWPGMNICCMTLKGNGANFIEPSNPVHNTHVCSVLYVCRYFFIILVLELSLLLHFQSNFASCIAISSVLYCCFMSLQRVEIHPYGVFVFVCFIRVPYFSVRSSSALR